MLTAAQKLSVAERAGHARRNLERERWHESPAEVRRRTLVRELLSPGKVLEMAESDFRDMLGCLRAFGSWPADSVASEILKHADMGTIRTSLHDLLYGDGPLETRLDGCRIRFLGTASVTEMMELASPEEYAPWNRGTRAAMRVLGIDQIPAKAFGAARTSGAHYALCNRIMAEIRGILKAHGLSDFDPIDLDLAIEEISGEGGRPSRKKRPGR